MPPDDLSAREVAARLRNQQVDYLARLLLARSEGVFDTDMAEELADLLATAPDVMLYPDETEEVA